MTPDVSAWPGLTLVAPVGEGHRNTVWVGRLDGQDVSVRTSRRPVASLEWELDLLDVVADLGVLVPKVLPSVDRQRHVDGVVVQHWLRGRPPESAADWTSIASTLRRIHSHTADYPQRPGCGSIHELGQKRRSVDADLDVLPGDVEAQVLAVFDRFVDVPTAVVHGDPMSANIRIDHDGRVGLLDWDESRVDVVWHDLSNLGVQVLNDADHRAAQDLSNAWEAVNAWLVEPDYARRRLDQL